MRNHKVDIPENIQNICKEFAAIAKKHNLHDFTLKFKPSFDDKWGGDVTCWWETGRHGEDMNKLKIASSFIVFTDTVIETKDKTEDGN